jgi:glycosyltransferase involved in cell wall biosynthesis
MKFAIISPVLPPSTSGQAIVLFRLLKNIDPKQFILISPQNYKHIDANNQNGTSKLGAEYYCVPRFRYSVETLFLKADRAGFGLFLRIYLMLRKMWFIALLKKEKCRCVVGCSADLFDPYCSCKACKKLNIPFIFYAFDDYMAQYLNKNDLYFSQKYGPGILRSAEKVLVPNEFLRDYYHERYDVDAIVIHNPVNLEDYAVTVPILKRLDEELSIVFTGAIYEAHYDAFNNLGRAIENLSDLEIVLDVYSDQELPEDMGSKKNYIVYHKHQHNSSMSSIQKEADLLFLPLAFNSPYTDLIIETSSPGKIGEYLAAKRPILVHAPPNSFVAWYFKKYNCGVVAESEDISDLSEKLRQILTNQSLRNEIITNAWHRACEDFDEKKVQSQFIKVLHDYISVDTKR